MAKMQNKWTWKDFSSSFSFYSCSSLSFSTIPSSLSSSRPHHNLPYLFSVYFVSSAPSSPYLWSSFVFSSSSSSSPTSSIPFSFSFNFCFKHICNQSFSLANNIQNIKRRYILAHISQTIKNATIKSITELSLWKLLE